MAMQVSLQQLNGEVMVLSATPQMTGLELKVWIRKQRRWKTTGVEVVVGDDQWLNNNDTKLLAFLWIRI